MEKYIGSIFVVVMVSIWWLLIFFDKKRIQKSAKRLGYTNVKVAWFPFTPSAFFFKRKPLLCYLYWFRQRASL
jgi:hypothetical protein